MTIREMRDLGFGIEGNPFIIRFKTKTRENILSSLSKWVLKVIHL